MYLLKAQEQEHGVFVLLMVLLWHRSLWVAFIGAEAIGREADQNTLAKIDYLIAFAILDQNTHDALIAIVFWIRSTDYIQQIQ